MADEIASKLQRWSTEDVPAPQRYEYYTDELASKPYPRIRAAIHMAARSS